MVGSQINTKYGRVLILAVTSLEFLLPQGNLVNDSFGSFEALSCHGVTYVQNFAAPASHSVRIAKYPDDVENLLRIFLVKIKVWNYVLGRRWKIYKDIPATKKGYSINHWCT